MQRIEAHPEPPRQVVAFDIALFAAHLSVRTLVHAASALRLRDLPSSTPLQHLERDPEAESRVAACDSVVPSCGTSINPSERQHAIAAE
jgi:hypothetical protein